MEFKVIRNEEGFLAEREAWTELYQKATEQGEATPFQSWEWCYYWWKYREARDSLFIIKAYTGKMIEGYAPLVVKNKMVEYIGGRDMDYGRFLIHNNPISVISGIFQIIKSNNYGFALQEMSARDTQLHIMERILENEKKYLIHRTTRTSYVNIANFSTFGEYLSTLSASMRNKTIKTALKRGITVKKEQSTKKLFEEIQQIYFSRQEARGGSSSISWSFPIIEQFVCMNLAEIYIARVEGKAVGFLISLSENSAKNIWLVAFHMDYVSYYPGQILFYQVILDSFNEKLKKVDFMRGDYDFKMRWNVNLDANYTIFVFPSIIQYLKKKFWFWLRPKLKCIIYSNNLLKSVYKKYV